MANIYNLEMAMTQIAQAWAAAPGYNDQRMVRWISTVFRRHIQEKKSFPGLFWKPVITQREHQLHTMQVRSRFFEPEEAAKTFVLRESSAEPIWVRRAISRGDAIWCVDAQNTILNVSLRHLFDYFLTHFSHKENWLMPVEDSVRVADEWVTQLNMKKRSDQGQTELMFSHQLSGLEVYLLQDKIAYAYEGYHMNHCVASYWGRNSSRIYSVRSAKWDTESMGNIVPVATFEISDTGVLVQSRGQANTLVSGPALDCISSAIHSMGFKQHETVASTRRIVFGDSDGTRYPTGIIQGTGVIQGTISRMISSCDTISNTSDLNPVAQLEIKENTEKMTLESLSGVKLQISSQYRESNGSVGSVDIIKTDKNEQPGS